MRPEENSSGRVVLFVCEGWVSAANKKLSLTERIALTSVAINASG